MRAARQSGLFDARNLAFALMTGMHPADMLCTGMSPAPTSNEQNKELVTMADKTGKPKPKRLSKSERTHRRRLKQAAGKPGAAGS